MKWEMLHPLPSSSSQARHLVVLTGLLNGLCTPYLIYLAILHQRMGHERRETWYTSSGLPVLEIGFQGCEAKYVVHLAHRVNTNHDQSIHEKRLQQE